jgi:hypothetical protein
VVTSVIACHLFVLVGVRTMVPRRRRRTWEVAQQARHGGPCCARLDRMQRTFTIDEARALMPQVRQRAARIIDLRATLTEARAHRRADVAAPALPELKAMEAHLQEALDWFPEQGIQVKGFAPLLIDFPADLDGEPVLLCWLENEPELDWYHPLMLGFMARRPLGDRTDAEG